MNITKYEIAVIGVRLVILYFILQLLGTFILPVTIQALLDNQNNPGVIWAFILSLSGLFATIICWFLASKIATLITRQEHAPQSTAADLQTCLFRTVGIFVVITVLPQLISIIAVLVNNSRESVYPQFNFIVALSPALKIILGLLLVFTAQGLSNLLNHIRYGSSAKL